MTEPLDLDALERQLAPVLHESPDGIVAQLIAELRATREWWKTEQALRQDLDERLREACCCGELSARAERAEAAIARVEQVVDARTPPDQCLYGDDGQDCDSHCDCGWGRIWYESVREALRGDDTP